MKIKILLLAMALLFSLNIKAQGMPTYDNTNFISLVKQLIESGKTDGKHHQDGQVPKDPKRES